MNIYAKSIVSAFVATVVLALLLLLKSAMGLMPQLNTIHMLAGLAHGMLGLPATPVVGWIIHFLIGTVLWGVLFALLYAVLPGRSAVSKALLFATGAWLLMMLIPLPLSGAGLFGLHIGLMAPVMTLILHWIWGAVLGLTFAALSKRAISA